MGKKSYTQCQKISIMKWRNSNTDKYNAYMNSYLKDYYETHADKYRKKRMDRYYFEKECQTFRNILISG
jgi:hypothetical protein